MLLSYGGDGLEKVTDLNRIVGLHHFDLRICAIPRLEDLAFVASNCPMEALHSVITDSTAHACLIFIPGLLK